MKHEQLIVFPDTNCLLHYPCIKDIDWRSLCDANVVRLILGRQVIAELDAKKSHPTLRERADRSIKEIRRLLKEGGHVRDNVTIESFKKDIPFSLYPPDLNADSQDDQIICHVMKCAEENSPIEVVMVSEDLGMEIRCETFNIRVIEPPRADRLANPTTDFERERNKAVKELNELKNRMPDIRIKISSEKARFEDQSELSLSKVESTPIDIEAEISQKIKKLSVARPFGETGKHVSLMDQISRSFITSVAEYDRYEKDLVLYLGKYRRHLESKVRFEQSLLRTFQFWIKIENIGNSPAAEVRVALRFDPVLQALSSEDENVGSFPVPDEEPKEPAPPRAISALVDLSSLELRTLDYSKMLSGAQLAGAPNVRLKGDAESGFLLHFSSAKLSHHGAFIRGSFIGMFKEGLAVKPFQVRAIITADDLPAAVERKLNILIGKRA